MANLYSHNSNKILRYKGERADARFVNHFVISSEMKRLSEKMTLLQEESAVEPQLASPNDSKKYKPPKKKPKNVTDAIYSKHRFLSAEFLPDLRKLEMELSKRMNFFTHQVFLEPGKGLVPIGDPHRKQVSETFSPCLILQISFQKAIPLLHLQYQSTLKQVRSLVVDYLSNYYPGYNLSAGNILMSTNGGSAQHWHRDYHVKTLSQVPLVFFLSISDHCRLDLFSTSLHEDFPVDDGVEEVDVKPTTRKHDRIRQQLKVTCGELLCFNGYAVHRGCAYDHANFRIHFYALHDEDIEYLDGVGNFTQYVKAPLSKKAIG
jgi:hypothetical protein